MQDQTTGSGTSLAISAVAPCPSNANAITNDVRTTDTTLASTTDGTTTIAGNFIVNRSLGGIIAVELKLYHIR